MKKFLGKMFFLATAVFFFNSISIADTSYPYTNPAYIPSAVSATKNYTAPGTYLMTLQNAAVVAFEINGTCTSLAATIQVSIDGTTWRTVNVYPVVTSTITAAAAISAAGAYRANVSGAKLARLNITALAATCNVAAVATSAAVALTL